MPLLDFLQSVGLGFRGRAGGIRSSPARPTRASQYGRPTLIDPGELQTVGISGARISPYTRKNCWREPIADLPMADIDILNLHNFFTRYRVTLYLVKKLCKFRMSISDYVSNAYDTPNFYTPLPARLPVRPTSLMSESDDDGE